MTLLGYTGFYFLAKFATFCFKNIHDLRIVCIQLTFIIVNYDSICSQSNYITELNGKMVWFNAVGYL